MIKQEISDLIKASIRKLQKSGVLPVFEIPEIAVDYPKEKTHGDYSTNIALQLVKIIFTLRPARRSLGAGGKKPLEVANLLADDLISSGRDLFEKVEVAMPGFINFFISKKELIYQLKEILREKNSYGSSKIGKGKTVVIDYSGPNIAKPFGIGHLRSTIIGQAYCDIYKFLGYKVIGDNHIGDWGTQFGKLIYAIKKWGNEKEIAKSPIKNLLNLYVKFHEEAEKNPDLENEGRKWFKKLEGGDKDAKRLWKKCVGWSMEEFGRIYKPLGIKFDYVLGESFYVPMLKDIIKEALDKKIAKKSQGAIIIEYPSNALPPLMIRKSDGTTLYSTRDLATIKYRLKKFKPIKIIYEVGVDQILHFKQLFDFAQSGYLIRCFVIAEAKDPGKAQAESGSID
ncbi:arginine--tRNA ligase [Patescibacteria group bacterium]|nr:arginine--tRNA ligase [Patescibacteria group bacterium]